MNKKNLIPIIIMLVTFTFFAGCTTTNTNNQTPSITITKPQNGAILTTNNIAIMVEVSNFNLVDKFGQNNVKHSQYIITCTIV